MGTQRLRVCPRCGEPVVFTMEFVGYEFVCVECGLQLGLFAAHEAMATPELCARSAELHLRYEGQRAERLGVPVPQPPPQDVEPPVCVGCGATAEGPYDHIGKPPHWFTRTVDGFQQFACSRECIAGDPVLPW